MSGPKIDYAELERQRQAELERQRLERLRKIREETDRLNIEISKTQMQIDFINKDLASLLKAAESKKEMELTVKEINNQKYFYKSMLAKALEFNVSSEPEGINIQTQRLVNETNRIMHEYSNKIKPLEDRMMDFNKQINEYEEMQERSKAFTSEKTEIKDIDDFDFSVSVEKVTCSDLESSVKENALQILSEIEDMVNSESIQEDDMNNLLAIAGNIYKTAFETRNSFEAASIEYKMMKSSIAKNIEIFDDIYMDYYAEYIAYLELINKHSDTQIKIVPKRKYRFESIKDIQNEIELITNKSKFITENNYIRDQIDDVMRLYGFDMSDNIILDENQVGNHYICKNKSGNNAIHIHISEKKQIMMEIIGLSESSEKTTETVTGIKIPSSDIDEQERKELLEEQGIFCKLHPKIVDELQKRGVVLQAKTRKAPDMKYSTKIVRLSNSNNVIDNELINKETVYNVNATKRNEKNKKQLKMQALKA